MGSQDQHRESEPQTAADAYAKARELEQTAVSVAREHGPEKAGDVRREAARMRRLAQSLHRTERRAKDARDAEAVTAWRRRLQAARTPGGAVLGGGDAA